MTGGEIVDDPLDASSIASSIENFADLDRRRESGHEAREVALQFSLADSVDKTLEVYRELAARREE